MPTEYFDVHGLRVANIKNDSQMSFFGIGVLAGSNFETPEIAGVAHFAEHMIFKGTEKRTWEEITDELTLNGANWNAYTNRTEVMYYAVSPQNYFFNVVGLISDMFFNSTFPEEELEKERTVIQEERKMYEDDPRSSFSDLVAENFFVWEKGHNIIGTEETINSISRDDIISFLRSHASRENLILVACGDIDSEKLKAHLMNEIDPDHVYCQKAVRNTCTSDLWMPRDEKSDISEICYKVERENVSQAIASMLFDGVSVDSEEFIAAQVLDNAVGGGMHSLLFKRLREELGLCYSTGLAMMPVHYPHQMVSDVYGFISPENVDVFIEESERVLRNLLIDGLTADDFARSKADYQSFLMQKMETSLGRSMTMLNRYLNGQEKPPEEIVENLNRVTLKDCNALLDKRYDCKYNWAVMIPKED